jgi:hypothetical protein
MLRRLSIFLNLVPNWVQHIHDVPCSFYPNWQWRTRYCVDSMLEHAVIHPIRHAFQLNELMKAR